MRMSGFLRAGAFAVVAGLLGCSAGAEGEDGAVLAQGSEALRQAPISGTDDRGDACSFAVTRSDAGEVTAVELTGTFSVDYKIPTPGSGIYGEQRWPGVFSSAANMGDSGPVVRRGWLGNGDIVEGRGHPIFWNNEVTAHKLTVTASIDAPTRVRYESTTKVFGFIPFTVSTLDCRLAR